MFIVVAYLICYDCMYARMNRHHLREVNTFKLKLVKYLVFDEADRLFEMGVYNAYIYAVFA